MDTQTLQQLINFLKEASPYLLSIGRQAVVAKMVDQVVGIVFVTTVLISLSLILRKWIWWIREHRDTDDVMAVFSFLGIPISGVACFFCVLVMVSNVSQLIQMIVAPDYAVVKILLEMGKLR